MAVVATEEFTKEIAELVKLLAPGDQPLAKLPKHLQEPAFLDYALSIGRIQVGRPDYSIERDQGGSESHDHRKLLTKIGTTMCWTSLNQPWHKTIYEFLEEDKAQADERLKLRVKLARRVG